MERKASLKHPGKAQKSSPFLLDPCKWLIFSKYFDMYFIIMG